MQIILLADIEKVGEKHTVVTVKDGYARNYLIPQRMAVIANETNMGKLDDLKRKEEEAQAKVLAEVQTLADKISGQVLKIGAKAGASGKIFGSVTNLQIAQALQEQLDIDIERRKIVLSEEIKTLGTYAADLDLHKEVEIKIEFEVVAE